MATSTIALCLLLFLCCSFAQIELPSQAQQPLGSQQQEAAFETSSHHFQRLSAHEPLRRIPSEAGFTEYFEQLDAQFQSAGVSALRRTIEPRGLLVPQYSNSPRLIYIAQGRGVGGLVFPGCPETYQRSQQFPQQTEEGQRQTYREEHQKLHYVRQGDIIAVPAGVASWFYNDGDAPVIAISVYDTKNSANQLEQRHREFLLAGRQQRSQQAQRLEERHESVLSGFDLDLLAQALGVDRELARKIQNSAVQKGDIVRAQMWLPRPAAMEQMEQQQQGSYQPEVYQQGSQASYGACASNGLEEVFCNMKRTINVNNAANDKYNPQGGSLKTINSQKLPILRHLQMSIEKGVLYNNAIYAPHWNLNCHCVTYVTRGNARVQVVSDLGSPVFDGELRQGQLLIIPQNYAVLKKSLSERFEWVSFKTNDNAMVSQIVGKESAIRAIPEEVIMNSYRISREEAKRLKFNRGHESSIFAPRHAASQF